MKTACDLPRDRPEDHKQNRSEPLNLMVERRKGWRNYQQRFINKNAASH